MNAKAKALAPGTRRVAGHSHRLLPEHGIEVTKLNAMNDAKIHEAPMSERTLPETVGMVFAAPVIGLAYAIAMPFVGLYLLARLALEALGNRAPATFAKMKKTWVMARNIGLFLAAPFIALAYVIALPIVGSFMIARLAREAHGQRVNADS